MDKNQELRALKDEYKLGLLQKAKELNEQEKFLEEYALKLNEKEDELTLREKSIQKFLQKEIEAQLDSHTFPQQQREPLIKKIIQELLLFEADELEENEVRERKFLRNEYKKLKHSLLHELDDIQFDSAFDDEDEAMDELDIEQIKQELKDELDYLEKRHPASQSSRMTKQDLIDFRSFDSTNLGEEDAQMFKNYLELYKEAKSRYDKFVFLTIVTGLEK